MQKDPGSSVRDDVVVAVRDDVVAKQNDVLPVKVEPIHRSIEITLKDEAFEAYDNFLKFLHEKSEMDLYYTLMNKVELCEGSESKLVLKIQKQNPKLEQEIKTFAKELNETLEIIFQFSENITPYKEILKHKIMKEGVMQKLAKNFADVQITDILMQPNSN